MPYWIDLIGKVISIFSSLSFLFISIFSNSLNFFSILDVNLSFIVFSSVCVGLLNFRNKFSLTASLPIVLNLCIVLYVIFSKNLSEDKVIYLCWTLLVGGVLQLSLLLLVTDREFWQ